MFIQANRKCQKKGVKYLLTPQNALKIRAGETESWRTPKAVWRFHFKFLAVWYYEIKRKCFLFPNKQDSFYQKSKTLEDISFSCHICYFIHGGKIKMLQLYVDSYVLGDLHCCIRFFKIRLFRTLSSYIS